MLVDLATATARYTPAEMHNTLADMYNTLADMYNTLAGMDNNLFQHTAHWPTCSESNDFDNIIIPLYHDCIAL